MVIRKSGSIRKWKRTRKYVFRGFSLLIIHFLFFGCYSYTHPSGKKERALRFAGDRYKDRLEYSEIQLKSFELKNYGKIIDTTFQDTCFVEEINVENILSIQDENESVFVVIWYPNCGSIFPPIRNVVRELQQNKTIPIILISLTYDLGHIIIGQFNMKYKTQSYVLDRTYGRTILEKHHNIIRALCANCFEKYGMDYTNIYGLLLNSKGEVDDVMLLDWNHQLKANQIREKERLMKLLEKSSEYRSAENP